jgi:hypothetical protein
MGLLRLVPLILFAIFYRLAGTERAQYRLWAKQPYAFGTNVANHTIIMLLGLAFCCLAPLIAPFALLYFSLALVRMLLLLRACMCVCVCVCVCVRARACAQVSASVETPNALFLCHCLRHTPARPPNTRARAHHTTHTTTHTPQHTPQHTTRIRWLRSTSCCTSSRCPTTPQGACG